MSNDGGEMDEISGGIDGVFSSPDQDGVWWTMVVAAAVYLRLPSALHEKCLYWVGGDVGVRYDRMVRPRFPGSGRTMPGRRP